MHIILLLLEFKFPAFKHNLVCVSALAFTCICIHSLVKIIYLPPTSNAAKVAVQKFYFALPYRKDQGWDIEIFVEPDSISEHLFCEICCNVAKAPVQTSRAHLYCEACLLRWLEENDSDPSTNLKIEPDDIEKANRLVRNMILDLQTHCKFKCNGCNWKGALESRRRHIKTCKFVESRDDLLKTIGELKLENEYLKKKIEVKDISISQLASFLSDSLAEEDMPAFVLRGLKSAIDDNEKIVRL